MTRVRPRGASQRVHGEVAEPAGDIFGAVYSLVRSIPCGRVLTYGQISIELESRLSPVAVGWALHSCPQDVPWHRVVNASGGCSTDHVPDLPVGLQRALLEAEGVRFSLGGTVDLAHYRWTPPGFWAEPAGGSP